MIAYALSALLAGPAVAEHGLAQMNEGREIGVRFLGCELLAAGRILGDIAARLQLVDSESSHLHTESRALSEAWRLRPEGDSGKALADREVGRAFEASLELNSAREDAARLLAEAEKRVRAFKSNLNRELARGKDGQKLSPEADRMLRAARKAAEALARASQRLRAGQDILDGALALTGVPLRPWHRNYLQNGIARPDYGFGFAEVWEAELERAHHELHTGWAR